MSTQNEKPTILVPIDFTDCSWDLVQEAASVAKQRSTDVLLLHVMQLPAGLSESSLLPAGEGAEGPRTAREVLEQHNRDRMRPYLEMLRGEGLDAAYRVELGRPAPQILAAAGRIQPEAIVMGTHGRTGISRLVLGSVAEAVSRGADVPVVTVRTQHKPSCDASNCAWCPIKTSPVDLQLAAEAEG